MKIRKGFVSNSSSSSFVLDKRCMTNEDIEEFQKQRYTADGFDVIGETSSYFFGVIDYSNDFCAWLDEKKFDIIEWN